MAVRTPVVVVLTLACMVLVGCGSSTPPPEEQAPAEGDTVTVGTLSVGVASAAGFRTMTLPSTGPVAFTAMYGSAIVRLQELRLGAAGRLVYAADGDLYIMESDGSGATQLTSGAREDSHPTSSPNGTKVAFEGGSGGDIDIYVINTDGSGLTTLADTSEDEGSPDWSPDGTKIAFQRHDGNDIEIWVMDANGSGQTQLTDNDTHDDEPTWSPDGAKIAYAGYDGSDLEIYVMDADGSNQAPLTDTAAGESFPDWSPEGTKIAYTRLGGAHFETYVMNADGSGQALLTDDPADTMWPCWSPDGGKVAFCGSGSSDFDIYVVNADGSGQTQLTSNTSEDIAPTWIPTTGVSRTLIGANGTDRGYDPPFGASRPCAIVGLRRGGMVSAVTATMSLPHWPSLGMEALSGTGTELSGVKLIGANIKGIREDMGRGIPSQNWNVRETPDTGAVLVYFSSTTGEIVTVLATADKALGTGDTVASGGQVILRGTFTDVLTAPDTNLATGSTREVVLDSDTGEVVEVN